MSGWSIVCSIHPVTVNEWHSPGWTLPATETPASITPTVRETCGLGVMRSSTLTTRTCRSISSRSAKSPAIYCPMRRLQQKVLAGFNRNNGTTDEGGAIAEEYRVEYAVDRVKTTSTVWLGLTMECAECHDHKYDPISQEDYYRFYAFFNISSDGGMQTRNGNADPALPIPDPEKERQLPGVEQELAAARGRMRSIEDGCESDLRNGWQSRTQAVSLLTLSTPTTLCMFP